MTRYLAMVVGPLTLLGAMFAQTPQTAPPRFELVQADLFGAPGGQPNAWADFDGDGDLDLFCSGTTAVASRASARRWASTTRAALRNNLPRDRARQSVQVTVVDDRGRATRAGSEVRAYVAGRRTRLGTGLVDTGSGYCSQHVMPVHIGLGSTGRIDVEVTTMGKTGRGVTRGRRDPCQHSRRRPGCEDSQALNRREGA